METGIRRSLRTAWHAAAGTGTSWQPIQEFRLIFLAGTYFECNATGCDIIFYPDLDTVTDMSDSKGCDKQISLDQVTGVPASYRRDSG